MFWRIILTNSVKIKLSTINIHYVEFRASRSKLNSTRWFQLITNFNLTTTFTLSSRCKSNNSYSRWRSAANIFKHNPQWWKTKLVRYLILGWCDGIKIRIIVFCCCSYKLFSYKDYFFWAFALKCLTLTVYSSCCVDDDWRALLLLVEE